MGAGLAGLRGRYSAISGSMVPNYPPKVMRLRVLVVKASPTDVHELRGLPKMPSGALRDGPARVLVVGFVIRVRWQADVQTEGAIWTDREGPSRGG